MGPLEGLEPQRSGSWAWLVTKVLLLEQIRYLCIQNRAKFPGGPRARTFLAKLWRLYDSRWLMFLFAWRMVVASCIFTLKYPPTHDLVGFVVFYVVLFGLLKRRRRIGGLGRMRNLPEIIVSFVMNSDVPWYGGLGARASRAEEQLGGRHNPTTRGGLARRPRSFPNQRKESTTWLF